MAQRLTAAPGLSRRPARSAGVRELAGAARLLLLALLILAMLPLHFAWMRRPAPSPPARLVLRWGARLLRLQYLVEGTRPAEPCLYVANHVSWADILVLGATLPASFVAKSDVRRWPALGWLAACHGTIFVDRGRRSRVARQRDLIAGRLSGGGPVILFPEGTSSDGGGVLPFRPALLSAAYEADVRVRPVTIRWETAAGERVHAGNRLRIAWTGDASLGPHLWALIRDGGASARIILHEPLAPGDFASRADLAARARDTVAGALL